MSHWTPCTARAKARAKASEAKALAAQRRTAAKEARAEELRVEAFLALGRSRLLPRARRICACATGA